MSINQRFDCIITLPPLLLFLLLLQGTESNSARERFELFCSSVFEHHVSETHIILKTTLHSSNSAFKFSNLRLILQILTCRTLLFFRYCVLGRYGFTSFGLKYEVSRFFFFVMSSENLVPGFLSLNLVKEPVSKYQQRYFQNFRLED